MNMPTTITAAEVLYTYYETSGGDKIVYHGASHDDTTRQTLEFIRTAPKRSGVNYGVRRGYLRFTEDRSVTNADGSTVIQPSVTTASINWPVGVADSNATCIEEVRKLLSGASVGYWYVNVENSVFTNTPPDADLEYYAANGNALLKSVVAFFEDGTL